jgi:mannose-6-phosphate isomerase-like protein (cupin superfamily)
MTLFYNVHISKEDVFIDVEKYLKDLKFKIVKQDSSRPWGGFFVIDETQTELFIATYFPHLKKEDLQIAQTLSPKILIVAPQKRLSWQYHHRRAEIWKLIGGKADVVTSHDDEERNHHVLKPGDIIQLKQGERHRLVGTGQWGIVAEIWQHTQEDHPSDEDDIIRVQDDFGR